MPLSLRPAVDRISWRSPITISIAIAVAVNLILLGAWFWSRGGQTTDVRIETRDDVITVWLNGEQFLQGRYPDAAAEGKLVIFLEPTDPISSLPKPRGVDYVRVHDLDTGNVVFEDDFTDEDRDFVTPTGAVGWIQDQGTFAIEDGHLVAEKSLGSITLQNLSLADVRVDIRYHNITGVGAMLRAADLRNGIQFEMRPFRHYDSRVQLVTDGVASGAVGQRAEMPRDQVIKSMVATGLSFYPWIWLLLAAGFVLVMFFQFIPVDRLRPSASIRARLNWDRISLLATVATVAALAAFAFGVTQFLLYDYAANIPHVPDEVSYIFQAKILASGRFHVAEPPVADSFEFFMPALILHANGDWFSVYPFGHPMMLAIGERFGILFMIPPLIGVASVVATFFTGRTLYNTRTGLLAAAILACSPFFLMTASNFMSHNTAAMYICGSLLFLALREKRPVLFPLLSGICFGLLFNTRPLTAAGLVPAYAGLMLFMLWQGRARWRDELRMDAAWAVGGFLMLGAYGIYNWGTTGNPLQGQYQASGDLSEHVGFGGKHSVALGIQNEQVQLSMLVMVLNNWPAWLGFGVILLPFILGSRRIWDWFLLAGAVSVMAIYTLYEAPGLMHGPRYWYEAMPFLVLLGARGADRAAEVLAAWASGLRKALTGSGQPASWAAVAVVYAFVLAFVFAGTRDWLSGEGGSWNVDLMPNQASDLKGFNGVNDNLLKTIDDANLDDALVLLETCPSWQCYGVAFNRNSPDLDGDIVYAKDILERNPELFALYPDRRVYLGTYRDGVLIPYGVPRDSQEAFQYDKAPLAKTVPSPTPQPTPTPDVAAVQRRDDQRKEDLDVIAEAFDEYFRSKGSYPNSPGVTSLCVYSFDVGCAIKDVLQPLPADPTTNQFYWYQSDGQTYFYVFARMEEPLGPSECPIPIPEHLANIPNLYCVHGP